MLKPTEFFWLIPAFPIGGALLVGALLISFNRTMKRLSKPIAFLLLTSGFASTIISYLLLTQELSNETIKYTSLGLGFDIFQLKLNIDFLVDKFTSFMLSAISTISLISMFIYHFYRSSKPGYGQFFTVLTFMTGVILTFSLSSFTREVIENFIG